MLAMHDSTRDLQHLSIIVISKYVALHAHFASQLLHFVVLSAASYRSCLVARAPRQRARAPEERLGRLTAQCSSGQYPHGPPPPSEPPHPRGARCPKRGGF